MLATTFALPMKTSSSTRPSCIDLGVSFDFDVYLIFRYIMAMIMFVKVFQFRHPDLSANAYKVGFTKQKNIIVITTFLVVFPDCRHNLHGGDRHLLRKLFILDCLSDRLRAGDYFVEFYFLLQQST